ncbi:MAG TPA: cytochrome c oxidase assembly protein, partial [Gammaproteobacteria bacterium]|nr:cytochrome c oxidase assembly protein [Gammaproteobacteria bacterium]
MTPWEPSPTVILGCLAAVALYLRGTRRLKAAGGGVSRWRSAAFLIGVVLIYFSLQSYFDYLSQHMFWVHRLQHLVLHHIGPFLVVLAGPHEVMAAGLPGRLRGPVRAVLGSRPVRGVYRFLQNPVTASVLFVG